jgi:threonine-phosphate decarboxylase
VVGNGSTELISMLIHHRHPKRALLLGPTYSEYERELALCGGEIVMYNLSSENEFQLDFDDFFEEC